MRIFVCKETNYVEYVVGDKIYPFTLHNHMKVESEVSVLNYRPWPYDDGRGLEVGAIEVTAGQLQQMIN
jgi:hypothetical protein